MVIVSEGMPLATHNLFMEVIKAIATPATHGSSLLFSMPENLAEGTECCMETVKDDDICIHHVRGNEVTPHINQVFISAYDGRIGSY